MSGTFVKIGEFSNSLEAGLIKSRLESENIQVMISGEHSSKYLGEPVVLMVRNTDYDRAVAVLSGMEKEIRNAKVNSRGRCPCCLSVDIYYRRITPLTAGICLFIILLNLTLTFLPYEIIPPGDIETESIRVISTLISLLLIVFMPGNYRCRQCHNTFRAPVKDYENSEGLQL
ncbi:MAG: DUF2007 domain-containing protein [Deltaproteobacteria bacterium]|nr:DUF2007 domain-containing protein [Deltaproteobacteria bacterium]